MPLVPYYYSIPGTNYLPMNAGSSAPIPSSSAGQSTGGWSGYFNQRDYEQAQKKAAKAGASGAAPANPINPTQSTAIQSNAQNFDQIKALTELVNQLNQNAQIAANQGRIPMGRELETQSSQNISNALKGELGADVMYQLQQAAAERGAASGGGPNVNASYLRALGLNALDLQNRGQSWLTAAEGRNPAAPLFDPSSMFLTPFQQGQLDLQNKYLQLAALNAQRANRPQTPQYTGGSLGGNWGGYSTGGGGFYTPEELARAGTTYTDPSTVPGWNLPYNVNQPIDDYGMDDLLGDLDLLGGLSDYTGVPTTYTPDYYQDFFEGGLDDILGG